MVALCTVHNIQRNIFIDIKMHLFIVIDIYILQKKSQYYTQKQWMQSFYIDEMSYQI